jgi:hypothetical protein
MPIWEQPDDVRVAAAQARVERDILSRLAHPREALSERMLGPDLYAPIARS